jgi:hypothetical protein
MKETSIKIKKILTFESYLKNKELYKYLFEIQMPPENIKLWKVRYNFDLGTILVGDLLLDLEQERMFEIHPFPEWIVYLKSTYNVKSKPYLIVPMFSNSIVKQLSRISLDKRIDLIQKEIEKISIEDLIAFEYDIGINILVPAFIPHFFISSKINKEAGESPPYLQVFEPNLDILTKNLKIKTSYLFKLPFSVSI